jgi:maltooligosyltrehalose trehalohydrolase
VTQTDAPARNAGGRWRPRFGCYPERGGARFRVWAPDAGSVDLLLDQRHGNRTIRLDREGRGLFTAWVGDALPGDRYRYRLDEGDAYPDPVSRYQPEGVHGPSEVVDPGRFAWSDDDWTGVAMRDMVLYELHVGTFTPEGTFQAAIQRLPHLADLGVTAIELMPVADFAGDRNWGYDGVALFAPARCYGTPDDLRRLVREAHAHRLAVVMDVVYNHLGPDGAYVWIFSPPFFSDRHESPWGAAVNLDGPHSDIVRSLLIENALHWVHEYHIDGLRLDATHALMDDSALHFLAELTAAVHAAAAGNRQIAVIAENDRNSATIIRGREEGGWGLDGVWADDFHHQVRRMTAGDDEGYYRDYTGTTQDLAATIRQGWFFTGQHSIHFGGPRGSDSTGLPLERFVVCIQNHDQVGNRAFGERLHHEVEQAVYRAVTALLLLSPSTPLIFMGQEWAATSPFLYFTDHHDELGRAVTKGRRNEFADFTGFAGGGHTGVEVPDPQDVATFEASRLRWEEIGVEPHRSVLRLYAALLELRRKERLSVEVAGSAGAEPLDEATIALRRETRSGSQLVAIVRFAGGGRVELGRDPSDVTRTRDRWRPGDAEVVLTTEDDHFTSDTPQRPVVQLSGDRIVLEFSRPGAVVLRVRPAEGGGTARGAAQSETEP